MSRARDVAFGLLTLGWFVACGEPASPPTVGTNSNWFVACSDDEPCSGEASCECSRCTRPCSVDADCAALDGARCAAPADPAALSQCHAEKAHAGICLPRCEPGDCAEGEACVAGSCVTQESPTSAFCAPVAASARADREAEDQLLELVQAMRVAGGVSCGSAPSSAPTTTLLRASGNLRCAARVLATDLDVTGASSLLDSSGRSSQARLEAADYASRLWAESFAFDARDASEALASMLADPSACSGLTREGYAELAVAHVGRVHVVTLGAR